MTILIISILFFAAIDRCWGSQRRVLTVSLVLAATALAFWQMGVLAAALVGLWAVYRSLSMAGGGLAPKPEQRLQAFARHIPPALIAVTASACGLGGLAGSALFTAYGVAAGTLACLHGASVKPWVNNTYVELARGACFGLSAGAYYGLYG